MSKRFFKSLLILFLSVGLTAASFAQETTGSITGTITDEEANPLPGVSVTINSPALMGTLSYVTSETGSFRFPALPVGRYVVKAEMAGFKTYTRGEVAVRVGMVVTIDIVMEVTALEEQITVTATSPVVDVEQSKISVVMDKD
ncbi:MAG: carboxypeptidase-like regulatory domain-containing protein, partial [Candidatus Aminicenantes bacterium]|nr:carboxypeptidase-like regulatory domain-containing protein [Candidatus Aminicenantes bacterium]